MNDKLLGAVMGAFAADSFALGSHWIYDGRVIADLFGQMEELAAPHGDSYHKNRKKGEFTHYGDQTFWLLEHLAQNRSFDPRAFARMWQDRMKDYDGYMDKATKQTLETMKGADDLAACGSTSDDMSAAVRMAPLALVYHDKPEEFIGAARAQAAVTHNNPDVLDGAEFMARALMGVLDGGEIKEAIQAAASGTGSSALTQWVNQGLDNIERRTSFALKKFGLACAAEMGFPGIVYLAVRYGGDFKEALRENTMAGGDSAARGLGVGMLLGARHGISAIPESWRKEMKRTDEILALCQKAG